MARRTSELLNIEAIRFEPVAQRIRGVVGPRVVVDTQRAVLVWQPGHMVPVWAYPEDDVTTGAVVDDMVERYDDPDLAGHLTVAWNAMDRWLVDDEVAVGHPRDPFKRIDVRRSSHLIEVRLDDTVLARSTRSRLLYETGLPVRHYLPAGDVDTALFVPSDKRSVCAYKGEATYRSIRVGETVHEDLVWSYPFPLSDAHSVGDLWCFYDEKVDVTIDGEPRPRPTSPFS